MWYKRTRFIIWTQSHQSWRLDFLDYSSLLVFYFIYMGTYIWQEYIYIYKTLCSESYNSSLRSIFSGMGHLWAGPCLSSFGTSVPGHALWYHAILSVPRIFFLNSCQRFSFLWQNCNLKNYIEFSILYFTHFYIQYFSEQYLGSLMILGVILCVSFPA